MRPSESLTARLAERFTNEPERVACNLVSADGSDDAVTVGRLIRKAMAYAEIYGRSDEPQVVAVCLRHSLDLLAAFLGGLWAGQIPTILSPPSPRMEPTKYADSFRQMLLHIRPSALVISTAVRDHLSQLDLEEAARTRFITAESVPAEGDTAPVLPSPDAVALLQHSSGTTGLQKGVALSHRSVLDHNRAYTAHLGIQTDDVIASWLPLYHDMGFVACFLLPLLEGVRFVQISPFDWVLRPALLLEQIHRHRATLCWLPNFAFSFLAKNIREGQLAADLDLSSIRAWVDCSEPVTSAALGEFVDRFEANGVHAGQLTASYAMAENVFAVTQSLPGALGTVRVNRRAFEVDKRVELDESPQAMTLVSSGPLVEGTEMRILDAEERAVADDVVGDIAIRGPHLFAGYFRRDDLTAKAMTADGWYRTGDLGFLRDGQVYVTGRKKDLIIIQGRNIHSTDVELVTGRVEGVNPGRVVAFGIPDEQQGTDRLVIVLELLDETSDGGPAVSLKVRKAISQELDCTPSDVRVVPARWLVKSTSGKLARSDNRAKYIASFLTRSNDV